MPASLPNNGWSSFKTRSVFHDFQPLFRTMGEARSRHVPFFMIFCMLKVFPDSCAINNYYNPFSKIEWMLKNLIQGKYGQTNYILSRKWSLQVHNFEKKKFKHSFPQKSDPFWYPIIPGVIRLPFAWLVSIIAEWLYCNCGMYQKYIILSLCTRFLYHFLWLFVNVEDWICIVSARILSFSQKKNLKT